MLRAYESYVGGERNAMDFEVATNELIKIQNRASMSWLLFSVFR